MPRGQLQPRCFTSSRTSSDGTEPKPRRTQERTVRKGRTDSRKNPAGKAELLSSDLVLSIKHRSRHQLATASVRIKAQSCARFPWQWSNNMYSSTHHVFLADLLNNYRAPFTVYGLPYVAATWRCNRHCSSHPHRETAHWPIQLYRHSKCNPAWFACRSADMTLAEAHLRNHGITRMTCSSQHTHNMMS